MLRAQAQARGEATFVRFKDQSLSFAELDRLATKAAKGYAGIGVAHGARVCIALPNGIDFLVAWFGLARLGAIEVPINLEFKGAQVRYVIEDAGAEIIVTSPSFLLEHQTHLEACARLHTAVLIDEPETETPTSRLTVRSFEEMLEHEFDLAEASPVRPSDPVAIMYTSGTTG
jgi:crotonobetaine/carnitine-CoA ligase